MTTPSSGIKRLPASQVSPRYFFLLALVVMIVLLITRRQEMTGDEPRYLLYAASLLKTGHFIMPLDQWKIIQFNATGNTPTALPSGANGVVLLNGVYLPALLSPIASLFSLRGVRFTTLVAGLIGLYFLCRLAGRLSGDKAAKVAVAIAALSVPLLPYLHLFYMETFVFALICISWERVQRVDRAFKGDLFTAVLILAIPFVHMRGSVVAGALFVIFLWQLYRREMLSRAIGFAALAAVALALLIGLNVSIYGSITGPVNSARPPLPSQWFSVISMQLFNIRHGLFAYAPIWILGYAGLWMAAFRRSRIGTQALVLATIAALTGVGVNPGECWPARFWVMSIPMLTIGLSYWWFWAQGILQRAVAWALIAFTLVNTIWFVHAPTDYLSNRQSGVSYQAIFDKIGHFNPGLMLPVELSDAVNIDLAHWLAIGAGIVMILMIGAAMLRVQWLRTAFAALAGLILLGTFDMTRVTEIPASDYAVTAGPGELGITFKSPVKLAYVQIGRSWETWYSQPELSEFTVASTAAGKTVESSINANQVVKVLRLAPIQSVRVTTTKGVDLADEVGYRLTLYRSRSVVLRALMRMGLTSRRQFGG